MTVEKQAIIQLKKISVQFQNQARTIDAVQDVSLTVTPGDIYGIIGYSGAGKSTLVRVINFLQRPTQGTVTVAGQDLGQLSQAQLRQARKNIGMIFQHFNLMASRTVFGNIEFPLLDLKLSKIQRQEKVTKLLDLVGLADLAQQYPSQLSGGQKQRVAIARALASDPQILISDEATSALDPETTTEILNLLRYLNKQLGITIVIITHEMDAIKQVCNRVAVMDQGQVIEKGTVLEIFGHPKAPLTRKFVDSSTQLRPALKQIKANNLVPLDSSNLVVLNYTGEATEQPLVLELYKRYQVSANILFSNIEQLQGTTVGIMLLLLEGEPDQIQAGLDYLRALKVRVKTVDLQKVEVD
ncbi:ATP-binding cassette domain-containing protein [Lactobacillus sp. DCY120]|uniref:ATP-binding cassette domain-containing protein n=1 Tax=Bombilactobacillus apium TaxID=2675299 RepID=A0A850QYM6_9LACO|nr:ATP-binding cassette domain-containing protein [Bombilactobacillus apium]NVY95783.1 ATP-binding cassette domain-containing protein [Bombilactobacillus apium]